MISDPDPGKDGVGCEARGREGGKYVGGEMAEATLLQETLNACPVRTQSP